MTNEPTALSPSTMRSRWLLLFGMDWRIYLVYEHPDETSSQSASARIVHQCRAPWHDHFQGIGEHMKSSRTEDLGSIHDEFKVVVPPGGFCLLSFFFPVTLRFANFVRQCRVVKRHEHYPRNCELPDGSSSLSVPNVSIVPTFFQPSFNGNMKSDVGTRKNLYASVTLSCGDTVFFFSTDLLYLPSYSPCPKKKKLLYVTIKSSSGRKQRYMSIQMQLYDWDDI